MVMAAPQQALIGKRLHAFISYAREDSTALRTLRDGLEMLNHEVWFDQLLNGGQDWWDRILQRIRECDVMIVALSPALLESDAAVKEREYARLLGKPLLPAQVDPVLPELLPPDIAPLQIVDYTNQGPIAGLQLASALAALPPAPPLPEPLPEPPARPVPPLAELAQRLNAQHLSLQDQLALVASLRYEITRARERTAALELVRTLRKRPDLYHATWRELDELVQREWAIPEANAVHVPPMEEPPTSPPDWYPDPSGRHQLRWFDGDWTPYASDNGTVLDDPNF
jgi:hypothetical protein